MTIVSVELLSTKGGVRKSGNEYTLDYLVGFTGEFDVIGLLWSTDADLPKLGYNLLGDSTVWLDSIDADLLADSVIVGTDATPGYASYRCKFVTPPTFTYDPSPVLRPPEISGGGSELTEVRQTDVVSGELMVNSAGDVFLGIPPRPIPGGEVTITRNESTNPASDVATYSYSMNDAAIWGMGKNTLLFGKITYQKVVEIVGGVLVEYWKVSYPIRFRPDGWKMKLIDNGYRALIGGVLQKVTDDYDHDLPVAVLLNGVDGQQLPDGGDPVVFPADGYFNNPETAWSSLALPNPFA